ncbi:transcription regulator HTH, apses-type DNA-binding domain-containing protein [Cantharellus anzutake]|uniref:transcription regulator HTH, apses-type DNA-binding domain-containing protein n=1 Tax=Cantharellus anzutake TaxID=1750568 RepID=UPI001905A2D0|nr:transcription regulator HTH, apses-type DNA-binding domain-containing protein [Cantharellus anzutake]KAF8335900.1 transcription regulator HTH, apses-type DNA-binding domain-containing protein [Cantharellus anzutake]
MEQEHQHPPYGDALRTLAPQPPVAPPVRYQATSTAKHRVTKGRYLTSNDPRGYIPVYEYPIGDNWIMMDADDGYILWTAIWKALGNAKADIVKMLDNMPEIAPHIRRVRGGYLKIQGTWMKYDVALTLARRVAHSIAEDLIPVFGYLSHA